MDPEKARRYDEARARGMNHEQAVSFAESGSTEQPGRLESFGRGVAQGATLGFADEATSAIKGLGAAVVPGGRGFRDTYGQEVEESRGEDRAAREAHPGMMMAGELTGAVAPALATSGAALLGGGGAAAATRVAPTLGKLALSGAVLGGLDAAGRAEGNVVERLPEAATGAGAAAVFSVALPFIGKGLGRVGTAMGLRTRAPATRAADEILDALSGPPASVRGRLTGTAGETLMDVEPGVRNLGETAALYPGAREAMEGSLETRARGQFSQFQGALEAGTGLRRTSTSQLAQSIDDARRAAAKPLYDQAYAQGQIGMTPALQEVLRKPSIQMAFERAKKIAAEEGVDLGEIGFAEGSNSFVIPTVQAMDYVKRGLDDVLYTGKQPQGGLGPAQLHAIRQTRRALMDEVDRLTGGPQGAYAQARAVHGGAVAMQDALELGRTRFHLDPPDELAMMLDDMGPGEVEMFRRGAVDNVLHRLGNVPDRADLMKRVIQSPNEVQRMALLFDDPQEFQRFTQQMGAMAEQGITRNTVLAGSPTARRLTGREALEGKGAGSAFSLRAMLDEIASGRRANVGEATANELAPMLTKTGADLPTFLDLLEGRAASRARTREVPRALTRVGAIGAGGGLSDLFFGDGSR